MDVILGFCLGMAPRRLGLCARKAAGSGVPWHAQTLDVDVHFPIHLTSKNSLSLHRGRRAYHGCGPVWSWRSAIICARDSRLGHMLFEIGEVLIIMVVSKIKRTECLKRMSVERFCLRTTVFRNQPD